MTNNRGYLTDSFHEKIAKVEIQFLMFISTLGIVALAIYSYLNITAGDHTAGIIELGLALALLISLINMLSTGHTTLTKSAGAVVLMALVINNTLTGGLGDYGLMWSYIFPGLIFFLIGSRNGIYTSLILFALLATILSLQTLGFISTPFDSVELASHYASMGLMTMMIYVYQKTNEQNSSLTGEINRRLIDTSREMTKQTEQYNRAQKKLFRFNKSLAEQAEDIASMQEELLDLRKEFNNKKK